MLLYKKMREGMNPDFFITAPKSGSYIVRAQRDHIRKTVWENSRKQGLRELPKAGGYILPYILSRVWKELILRVLPGANTECSVYWKIHLAERTILKELSSNIPLLRMINLLVLFPFLKVRGISCLLDGPHIW